ncbi:unnamed protein product [Trifolium pratense]|uniref:Uncharacterized protein n=1 Tax=Trifolium pratense TaxID=57577 RepID=A0ACB0L1X9_TRIPR|nr:unnamed protein product [Trifolium pratense]
MDHQEREIAINRWFDLRRRAVAQLMCAIVYLYVRMSRKRKLSYSMSSERERVREEIMYRISNCETSRNLLRMSPQTFLRLCDMLEREGGLQATRWSSVEEQVAKTIYILTHNVKNREVKFWFRRSGETISRHFHQVLKAILELEEKFIVQPDGSTVPLEISSSSRFYPYFKDCVGAIDGTHIRVKVSAKDAPRYRGRKDYPTQNVLAACTFDLKFTYVLAGWEGSASDSRIIKNALTREDKLKIPQGKYYLVDAGFMLTSGLITPYRGVRYHLKEYSAKNPPQNYKELFNLRHASLRNAIERAFGVLKKRFEIISNSTEPNYGVKAQKLIIFACCILHNYLMSADPDEDLIAEVDAELANQNLSQENHQASTSDRDEVALGGVIKNSVAHEMWLNYENNVFA